MICATLNQLNEQNDLRLDIVHGLFCSQMQGNVEGLMSHHPTSQSIYDIYLC